MQTSQQHNEKNRKSTKMSTGGLKAGVAMLTDKYSLYYLKGGSVK